MTVGTVLLVLLILLLIGALPTWPHSKNWGYYPRPVQSGLPPVPSPLGEVLHGASGGLGLLLVMLVILLLMGRL